MELLLARLMKILLLLVRAGLTLYLEDKLELVLDIVCPCPGWLGGGHLNDDTSNTPHITLPPIAGGGSLLCGPSTYHLCVCVCVCVCVCACACACACMHACRYADTECRTRDCVKI